MLGNVRRRSWLLVAALLLPALSLVPLPPDASALPHAPIRIDGDAEFTAANGVTGGSGTPSDPFVISGWEIDASGAEGVLIQNTSASFAIRDVTVHSGGPTYDGIVLYGSDNGRIENSTLEGNRYGIHLESAQNVVVASNTITGSASAGVHLRGSGRALVHDNTVTASGGNGIETVFARADVVGNRVSGNGGHAVEMGFSDGSVAAGNVLSVNAGYGVAVSFTENATVADNEVRGNAQGVQLFSSRNVSVERNLVADNPYGIFLRTMTGPSVVAGNHVSNSTAFGIRLQSTVLAVVRHNRIVDNAVQAFDDRGAENAWDDGYPSGGNYWSDYAGVDLCGGPLQDVCPGRDGLGDTPRAIDADSEDRYPLVNASDDLPPVVSDVRIDGEPGRTVPFGGPALLTARANDAATGGSRIDAAWYLVDGATPVAMVPADGAFDTATEDLEATIDTRGWSTGPHEVCVLARDGAGNVGVAAACGTLRVNAPPIASAGPDRTVGLGESVVLDGNGSLDPDGDPLTFSWIQLEGPVITLEGASSAAASFTPTEAGTYVFGLVVHDGTDAGVPDRVTIVAVSGEGPPGEAFPWGLTALGMAAFFLLVLLILLLARRRRRSDRR